MIQFNYWRRLGSVIALAIITTPTAVATKEATLPANTVLPINKNKLIIDLDNPPKPTYPKPSLELLNRYDWRLIENQDKDGRTLLKQVVPLNMNIRPSMVVFSLECQRYIVSFYDGHGGDYPYSLNSVADKSSCQSLTPYPYLEQDLNTTFDTGYRYRSGAVEMGFAWLDNTGKTTLPPDIDHLPAKAQLAVHTQNTIFPKNSHLIWQGTLKPIKLNTSHTPPITKDLLQSKQWRLKQSNDKNGQPIQVFGYANIPILASFYTRDSNDPFEPPYSGASFRAACNGLGAPYVLTPENKLLIGLGFQTMMGCSSAKEKAEETLNQLMHHSTSQLKLKPLDSGEYALIQKLATGETLIWHSEPKSEPP